MSPVVNFFRRNVLKYRYQLIFSLKCGMKHKTLKKFVTKNQIFEIQFIFCHCANAFIHSKTHRFSLISFKFHVVINHFINIIYCFVWILLNIKEWAGGNKYLINFFKRFYQTTSILCKLLLKNDAPLKNATLIIFQIFFCLKLWLMNQFFTLFFVNQSFYTCLNVRLLILNGFLFCLIFFLKQFKNKTEFKTKETHFENDRLWQ